MIIDGKALATKIKTELKNEVSLIKTQINLTPKLAVVLVGSDPASCVYVKNKKKGCEFCGIDSVSVELDENTTQLELEKTITDLNNDPTINGILLQLPLPNHLNEANALALISHTKDVDGLGIENLGKIVKQEDGLTACTPTGIMEIFKEYNIDLAGKDVVIINRSILVGKPLANMLTNANATVTLCHSKTKNLKLYTQNADIVITAVGKPNFLTADMIKENCVVIDVAIIRQETGLCGDADFENVSKKASFITPVPGGVGPLTIAMLLKNTVKAFKIANNLNKKM